MKVHQYKALTDNYHFLVYCSKTKEAVAIDICETQGLFDFINEKNLTLKYVLNTHHHHDHVGGNREIKKAFPYVKFLGPKFDFDKSRIPCQDNFLNEGDKVVFGDCELKVIHVPGHTLGHIAFYSEDNIFVGDTVFVSGCGRLFEGTPLQMVNSFKKIIAVSQDTTNIYCAHEYTLSNLKFALSLNKEYFSDYFQNITRKLEEESQTVPSTLEMEKKYNPFFMVINDNLRGLVSSKDCPIQAFAEIRDLKDRF